MKGTFTHPNIAETPMAPSTPPLPDESLEEARLWARYTDARDAIVEIHERCRHQQLRSPRMVFIFCATKCPWRRFGGAPKYVYPKRRKEWLRKAIRFAEGIVANPHGSALDTPPGE